MPPLWFIILIFGSTILTIPALIWLYTRDWNKGNIGFLLMMIWPIGIIYIWRKLYKHIKANNIG